MRGHFRGIIVLALVAAIAWAAAASARPYLPPGNHIFAGLTGGTSIEPYERMAGKHPAVFEDYMTWDTPSSWISSPDIAFRSRLGLELSTSTGYGDPGVISPESIALGHSDRFLVTLNRNLEHSGRIVYIRIMGEMDGYWNAYSAYAADGAFRGSQNSPHYFIEAWRRTVLILRGGTISGINRRLRALGLPKIRAPLLQTVYRAGRSFKRHMTRLPRPRIAFLWVPQDAGSPEIAANSPGVYWPGSAYVDWVGTDFYSSYPNFALLDDFYNEFTGQPFVISEWAVYGADAPGFVDELFAWVRSHPRVRMLNYYQGFTSSSRANLAHYPQSQQALRAELRSKVFLAYPPEYAHPKRHKHHKPKPVKPPLPPQPGPPPSPPNPGPPTGLCVPLINLCIPGL